MNDSPAAIPNVLAERYASAAMKDIWSQHGRVALERDFWIAVMKAQRDLGVPIPADAIKDYEKAKDQIDLAAIAKRERVTLHDVKARIEEFSALAGHEHAHKGMTSRDLTENVEQLQVRAGLELVRDRAVTTLVGLARRERDAVDLVHGGRRRGRVDHDDPLPPAVERHRAREGRRRRGQQVGRQLRPGRAVHFVRSVVLMS